MVVTRSSARVQSSKLPITGELDILQNVPASKQFETAIETKYERRLPLSRSGSGSPLTSLSDLSDECSQPKRKRRQEGTRDFETQDIEHASGTKLKKSGQKRGRPEPVYAIPDVDKKETSFRGRLGYACQNTILRNKNPADEAVFCSRTCRIETIRQKGLIYVHELARRNLQDLLTIIQWNEDNNIRFMRVSSDLFPFASHLEFGYPLTDFMPLLSEIGALARKYGHRLTTHPGQFVQLGTPNDKVRDASIRELVYHCEFMDGMGIDKDGVCIIHGGGMYGDKSVTLERLKTTIKDLLPQNVRDRLVLENDEICYTAEDLLPICEELQVPLIFDHHHDALNPSSIPPSVVIARTNAIFFNRGIKPKQHVSEPRPGAVTLMERRAHSDRVEAIPDCGDDEVDLMIEAKDKEQAVLHLYRIYGLERVSHASLRPPAEIQTKETRGRKSSRKKGGKQRHASLI